MNREQLHRYILQSTGNESNICQIYAIRDGETVLDDCWHGFKSDDAANVNSVTKGIVSLIAGIALDKDCIKSVDQRVMDFFPDYTVKRGEKTINDVTVRHLLTMTAPYKGKSEPWKKVCTSEDWTIAILDYLGGRKGITGEFRYATLGIQILVGIIERATGEKCIDFANDNLFDPLGLPRRILHGDSSKEDQFDFFMNKNPRKPEWYSDPQKTVTAGWGLCMSARDMAVVGELVLNGGTHDGKRIISEDYLKKMLRPHLKLGEKMGYMNYGYLWYKPFDQREVYAAIGDCGNIIYVNKEDNISVGITGTFKPRIFDRVHFIEEIVLPAIMVPGAGSPDLARYDGKYVAVTDIYGDKFSGRAQYGGKDYLECEYGGKEDGIFIEDILIYNSQIESIEEIIPHGTAELWTENLILRRYLPDDAEQLYERLGTDPEMYRYSGWNPYATLEMAQETVNGFMESYSDEHSYSWVMDFDGVVVGTIGAYDYAHDQIEVGFCVAGDWQGRGFATEALNRVLEYLSENEGILHVTAWCADENTASRRVLEKSGMRQVQTKKGDIVIEDRVYDKLSYEYP